MSDQGFLKLSRSEETEELMRCPAAFMLLTQIAYRARRRGTFSVHNLEIGQAFIGDFDAVGLSEKQYRNAKNRLEEWGFATFKGTNKGTIATITNTRIYDINPEAEGEQRANEGRAEGEQRATNEEGKNKRRERIEDTNTRRPSQEEIEEFVISLGLPKTDGEACYNKWTGNGWKNGSNPIKDWKATIRSWKLNGYLPSQKAGADNQSRKHLTPEKAPLSKKYF